MNTIRIGHLADSAGPAFTIEQIGFVGTEWPSHPNPFAQSFIQASTSLKISTDIGPVDASSTDAFILSKLMTFRDGLVRARAWTAGSASLIGDLRLARVEVLVTLCCVYVDCSISWVYQRAAHETLDERYRHGSFSFEGNFIISHEDLDSTIKDLNRVEARYLQKYQIDSPVPRLPEGPKESS